MRRRDFVKTTALATAAAPFILSSCRFQNRNRPNVLFIAVDDLNSWVGCVGGHPNSRTPNIDRLASRGTVFTNAHCQGPICGPSRTSLMTGLYPHTTGIYGQIADEDIRKAHPKTASSVFLTEYFGLNGYDTRGIGKLYHIGAPKGAFGTYAGRVPGFGPVPPEPFKWDGKTGRPDYEHTSTDWGVFPEDDSLMPDYQSAQWAIEQLDLLGAQPFFLGVGFLRPHVPWLVPQKWFDLHPLEEIETPPYRPMDLSDVPDIARRIAELPQMPTTDWAIENDEWKKIVQAYLACVSFADHYVGEILDALESSEHADNTVVVLWADHGYHIGEKGRFGKHSLWEEATQVPLIMSGPGITQGQSCSMPVGNIDIYPTLVDLCRLPENPQNEGNSLGPLLEDSSAAWDYVALTTYGRNNHAVRDEHYRYIRYEDGSEELYDHRTDSDEWTNIAAAPEMATEKERLMQHLPAVNGPWSPVAVMKFNEYFREHSAREAAR
ncbi:MAG: sulfatase [Rhodothermales bacterium]|nr:sulfatase [Rhodothermales bacterium]